MRSQQAGQLREIRLFDNPIISSVNPSGDQEFERSLSEYDRGILPILSSSRPISDGNPSKTVEL